MTFFYDLNKKLDSIRAKPETTHKQLNERDMSRAAKGYEKYGKEGMEALAKAGREGKALDPVRAKYDKYDNKKDVEEGLGSIVKKIGGGMKRAAGKAMDVIAPGDEALLKDLQKKTGMPQTGKPPMATSNKVKEAGAPMSAKQKSFAKLAPPADKITFADKIAGAKKEVDEVLGDVAANAMKKAISGHGTTKDKGRKEGWDDMIKDVERRRSEVKPGHKVAGAKGDIEKTATGIKHTRRYDDKTGETDTGDEVGSDGQPAKRGRGRPKGTTGKIGAKGPSGKSKLMTKEADHDSDEVKQAMAVLKKAGYTVSKSGEEELEEKAVSKKQQKFMGMVHATQKGEKAPSKEVAKVAKSMGKKDAEDFAATKHKGLPEKKKPEGKKKEKTEEAGGTGTPTASSGFGFGKGIYDSMNRDLEQMIADSMNISMSMNNDMHGGPSKSLTVTATDEDAMMLGKLLKMAGVGSDSGYGHTAEQVDENQPDWPTETETSGDALQYAGGLNKPKSTGQTTVPVIASQEDRQHTYEEKELDEQEQVMAPEGEDLDEALKRIKEMAGIQEAKKDVEEEKTDEGNRFTGNLAKARAAGKDQADLDGDGDMEKVRESVNAMWKVYKG
jgi:hypothetical protein